MIEALETVDADPSVLAHHAAAAGDVPRVLRYAPAAAAEASRSGAHREAVAFFEAALRHVGDDAATRATLLEAMSLDLYLTDRLRDAIAARERALDLRRDLDEVVAVGAGHTALAGFAWYAADRALAERHARAAIEILGATDDRRALGFAFAGRSRFVTTWPSATTEITAFTAPRAAAIRLRPRVANATRTCRTATSRTTIRAISTGWTVVVHMVCSSSIGQAAGGQSALRAVSSRYSQSMTVEEMPRS